MVFAKRRIQQRHTELVPGAGGDVLVMSMRRLADLVAYCALYEFEDVIIETTAGDRVEPDNQAALELSRRSYKMTRLVTGSKQVARHLAITPSSLQLQRNYELFFPVFNHPWELFALATLPNWRKHCKLAACFILEMWVHLLPRYLLELLSEFDHVFLGVSHPVEQVAQIAGRPCTYLPLGANVLRLSPFPELPARVIDVCNIGRRSQVTHAALLQCERDRQMFYYYDTVAASGTDQKQRTFRVQEASEHRLLLANLLQRSRYYVANRARINEPEFTMGRDEISGRFYEGSAAGTVMVGEAPRTDEFKRQFDWPDAVIHLPFDSPDAAQIFAELDRELQRLARIRRDNMYNAATRHDWVYRLRTVYETLGLTPTKAMIARETQLRVLAERVSAAHIHDL